MTKKYTVAFYTLGCRVNQYETRAVEELFQSEGFEICKFDSMCDVYVINTCTVTAESDRKSRQIIRRAVQNGKGKALVAVMGCMSQVSPKQCEKIQGVDIIMGNSQKLSCVKYVKKLLDDKRTAGQDNIGKRLMLVGDICRQSKIEPMSVCGSDNTRAFVKIQDGCENNCSYCIIPKARGKVRSKSIQEVVRECRDITEKGGAREIVLTGIETAAFGRDSGQTLEELARAIAELPLVKRIRFGSLEPTVITEQFAQKLSSNKKFMPHFHLSLQSGSDEILRLMRRKYNTDMFFKRLEILKKHFKDELEITTDIIVGFPGETRQMFDETVRFCEKCQFLYIHIFPYSDRDGTAASSFENKLSEAEKKSRASELNRKMLEVRKNVLSKHLGKEKQVLCETHKGKIMHGYTDNFVEVRVPDENLELCPNDIVTVKLEQVADDCAYVAGCKCQVERDF